MIITVGGNIASGKSTMAKALADELCYTHVSVGAIMRSMAQERNMSIHEFSKVAEGDIEIDHELDRRQKEIAKSGKCVIDGRLSAHFLKPDFSVWLTAPKEVRAQRLIGRGDEKIMKLSDAIKSIEDREASERKRYQEFYNIDLDNLSIYDMVLNTEKWTIHGMIEVALVAFDKIRGSRCI